jgi:endonuclease/exonuclease/phosphatase family metal-dependent hydrolase
MRIKIMQYNILEGFTREINNTTIYQEYRKEAVLKTVKEFDPDILVLCEACFSPSHKKVIKKYKILNDYAKIFNYKHYFYGQTDKRGGSAILSKFPLKATDYSLNRLSFIRSRIKIKKKDVNLDVVHPHPKLTDSDKMRFISSVVRDSTRPYILAGDFNALSPLDKYNKNKLIRGFKLFRPNDAIDAVEDALECKAISFVMKSGLKDTFKEKHKETVYTVQTKLFKHIKDAAMRLDYIFCSRDFKIVESGIIKNETTDKASDHYPIYAILDL